MNMTSLAIGSPTQMFTPSKGSEASPLYSKRKKLYSGVTEGFRNTARRNLAKEPSF